MVVGPLLYSPHPARAKASRKCPKRILAARPLLQRLARDVPATLGFKPALLVWGLKDFAFKPRHLLPQMQATFPGNVTVELPHAKHYIQEDAPSVARAASAWPASGVAARASMTLVTSSIRTKRPQRCHSITWSASAARRWAPPGPHARSSRHPADGSFPGSIRKRNHA